MASTTITSVQDGDWNTASTWDTGTVPTAEDHVVIRHAVTVGASFTAEIVTVDTDGSITVADSVNYGTVIKASVAFWYLTRQLNDTRVVRLDGVLLDGATPGIACIGSTDLPATTGILQGADIIITDPGYIGTSAKLQDINPEGCGRAYARKLGNAVRYLTVTVRISSSKPHYLGMLYRMAEGPYQVLLVTDRAIIKGYIETIAPDQASVGTGYISVRVTVAEGL